ncbi:827_t:CDS:2 [Paraglomus occultum]|uniref:827_t:CDS:1 n=1 Tax=Paraglomus occultum TaxID=144539 RepID=A0A9N9BKC0_9GLOM|nr:827_t:CDS:2 [Paraglomus occultum]
MAAWRSRPNQLTCHIVKQNFGSALFVRKAYEGLWDIPSLAAKIASDSRTQEQNSDKRSKSGGKKFDSRPPPHNKDATTPADVYKLQDVVPDLDNVAVVPLFNLPYMKSHLSSAIAANDVQKIKIILYLAYLIAFYRMGEEGQIGSRNFVEKKLKTASKSLIASLYNNFSETPAGVRTRAMFTKRASSKLLSYICVVCLIIDDFKVEFGQLVTDLQLQKIKLTRFFKNVGCTIEALTKAEREMLGVSYRYAAEHKFAILRIPFTIPEPTQKRMSKKTNA